MGKRIALVLIVFTVLMCALGLFWLGASWLIAHHPDLSLKVILGVVFAVLATLVLRAACAIVFEMEKR